MVKDKTNLIENNYIEKIVVNLTYLLREKYKDLLNNKKIEQVQYEKKLKEFDNKLEDLRKLLIENFAFEILQNGKLYYNSNFEYEEIEKEFGITVERSVIDCFGTNVHQILGQNLSISISANKNLAIVQINQMKDGILNTNKQIIKNDWNLNKTL